MLELSQLNYSANGKLIVNNVSVTAARGKLVGILGPSGAGKTTLFRLITGLVRPQSGHISFENSDLNGVPVSQRPISYLQQSFPLYDNLSVIDNVYVAFEKDRKKMSDQDKEKVRKMLLQVGIQEEMWDRRPKNLSGGETQRIALAKCLLKPSRILLLDEPYSNVDKNTKRDLMQMVYDIVKDRDLICLCISHDENDLLFMSDQLVVMHNGKVTQAGPPKQLLESPLSSKVASIGSMLGLQMITRAELSEMTNISEKFNFHVSPECTKIGWRPDRSKIVYENNENASENCICFRITIKRMTAIGDNIYYGLKIASLSSNRYFWHSENLYQHSDRARLIKLEDQCILRVDFKDLIFLDQEENVIPKEGLQ